MIGVAILVQPYGESKEEQTENTLGSILVLISSLLNAINMCLLRMMKDLHFAISPFYYGILGSVTSGAFILHNEWFWAWGLPWRFGIVDYTLFLFIGLTSAMGAMAKSLAFQYDKVSTLTPIKYTNLFYSLAADVLLFHSHIYPGEIIGALLIVGSSVSVGILKFLKII
jgi:drug/metabolite transporter (DMT)-like permease